MPDRSQGCINKGKKNHHLWFHKINPYNFDSMCLCAAGYIIGICIHIHNHQCLCTSPSIEPFLKLYIYIWHIHNSMLTLFSIHIQSTPLNLDLLERKFMRSYMWDVLCIWYGVYSMFMLEVRCWLLALCIVFFGVYEYT